MGERRGKEEEIVPQVSEEAKNNRNPVAASPAAQECNKGSQSCLECTLFIKTCVMSPAGC